MTVETENNTRSPKEMTSTAKYVNISIQVILILTTACIVARVAKGGIFLFTFHPVFAVMGYLILMSNAILTMADNNFLTQSLNYQKRVTVHWILQTSALILITIAQTCIFINKNRLGKDHYQSTHAIFGLITYILTLLVTIGGVATKYSFQLKQYSKPIITKIIHSFGGLVTYILAVITICLGMNKLWGNSSDAVIFAILAITTLYITIKSFILLSSRVSTVLKSG